MCTVVVLVRPSFVLLAANRDEQIDRPWDSPAAYWPDRPEVTGGRDRTGGGTWMAINRHGVTAAVLNRPGTLGPLAGKRSRGDLPLMAMDHATAADSAEAMNRLDASAWRGFNMVIADARTAWFVRGTGHGHPAAERLPPAVAMVTAYDPNDLTSPRTARHLPRLLATAPETPQDWQVWRAILADTGGDPAEQINVLPRGGFGTVCSSFVILPATGTPVWLFAAGPPHLTAYQTVTSP